jgi:hypothetical protein
VLNDLGTRGLGQHCCSVTGAIIDHDDAIQVRQHAPNNVANEALLRERGNNGTDGLSGRFVGFGHKQAKWKS